MASTGNASLSTLLQSSTLEDHLEILKACNASLKKSKSDVDAQQAKVVSLLKLDRFEEALHCFEESGTQLKDKSPLEYAYTLYKIGRLDEAAEVAAGIPDQRGAKHVEAQARYRAEDFSRTMELYKDLVAEQVSTEEYDLRVNQGALKAQIEWVGLEALKSRRPSREDLEAFETAYNAACGSIARGELGQAEVLLNRARQLCQHSEELTEDQKHDELLPIAVQQVYVLQRLGKSTEADEIASTINVEAVPDHSTRSIAQNNLLISSTKPSNPFLAHKLFNASPRIPENDKLFSYQARAFTSNAKTIDLHSFKFDGVASSTRKEILKHPQPTVSPSVTSLAVLNAAAHAKAELGKAALRRVLPELEKRPNDVGLIVTIVQLYILTKNITAATELLESFFKRLDSSIAENAEEARYSPGLVSILLGLYNTQGRKSNITQELAKAASYWRHKSKPPTALMHSAGRALLASSDPQDTKSASQIFSKLREQDPNDKATIAGYVASHASEAPEKLKADVEKLTPIAELIREIDIDTLENAGIPQSSNALAIAQLGKSRKRAAPENAPTKPKRIRKSRLPQDYDENKKPDPERWLPLRDRSTYRPKGKKKGKKGAGDDRTQGGVVADDVGVNGTTAPKASTVVTGGGGANKKKKGKGKK